jgi:hypothetical protein
MGWGNPEKTIVLEDAQKCKRRYLFGYQGLIWFFCLSSGWKHCQSVANPPKICLNRGVLLPLASYVDRPSYPKGTIGIPSIYHTIAKIVAAINCQSHVCH